VIDSTGIKAADLVNVARPAGFEPAALGLEVDCDKSPGLRLELFAQQTGCTRHAP
jgi:hypothetical protein